MLQRVQDDIDEDIRKQKGLAQRAKMKIMWEMAPIGYNNLRGRSAPGVYLGEGPLPLEATTTLRDPSVERALEKFYWDESGRRHRKQPLVADERSALDEALMAIKQAASNSFVQSLDIKKVFQELDTSGDGMLSIQEMVTGLRHMGVILDDETAMILFRHFDRVGSGSIHFGEFVWAFFNRRGFLRQWKKNTKDMNSDQIRTLFHRLDKNGDGRLTAKEFKGLLKTFGVEMHQLQVQMMMDRFDTDGDGEINEEEFMRIMRKTNLF